MGFFVNVAMRGGLAAARQVLQLEDRRTAQLNRLTSAVDAGLTGPYKAALEHLAIAQQPDVEAESVARHLDKAEDLFAAAYGNLCDIDPLQSAWAAVNIALICLALGRQNEARHWARLASERATIASDLVDQQLQDRADSRMGRLRLTSENTESAVLLGGAAATGLGAAAAGITIATGGLGIVAVGAGFGAAAAVSKGMQMYRQRKLKERDLKVREMTEFLSDITALRQSLGDS
jgi:hypothetical protein